MCIHIHRPPLSLKKFIAYMLVNIRKVIVNSLVNIRERGREREEGFFESHGSS